MAIELQSNYRKRLSDLITPVNTYLKVRDEFSRTILLESSDHQGGVESNSFIGMDPIAGFSVQNKVVTTHYPDRPTETIEVENKQEVVGMLSDFTRAFSVNGNGQGLDFNGFFGHLSFDAVQYFDTIDLEAPEKSDAQIPDMAFNLYRYIIRIDHFRDELYILENLLPGEDTRLDTIEDLILKRHFTVHRVSITGAESSNLSDEEYMENVRKGREHCKRGDVYQMVLSRQFSQGFQGDEFNVYRALRSVNPSPYLFYLDEGNYKIFGSSPESQIIIRDGEAFIDPIAGTFRRTGDDEADRRLAEELLADTKENAEHMMLVDLARNDLSRNLSEVTVEKYREIQFFSHVIHMVSRVKGRMKKDSDPIRVLGDSFPAGTLSGAPKYRAVELIDRYENKRRGYYGGSIGHIGLNGDVTHAIMIRSFLSKDAQLHYQAGAGIVVDSDEKSELQEVNNKLMALKKAIDLAKDL